MRWIGVVCVAVIGLGCARAHHELVALPAAPDGLMEPAIEQRLLKERLNEHVAAAKRMLKEGDLATTAVLLEEALRLDPTSRSATALQRQFETAQRRAEAQARRELISLYQREGNAILKEGDIGRALAYLQAAQNLDPTNRKIFQLIQRAHETQVELMAKQREQDFRERVRLAKADAQAATPTDVAATKGEELVALAAAFVETPVEPVTAQAQPALSVPAAVAAEPTEAAKAIPVGQVGPGVEEYTVQPEDVLRITVYEEEELNTKARVTSSGEITFPLLGHVAVAGLTVPQVQEDLTKLLAEDYLVNPQVQVFIEVYHPRNVFVTGAVNKPGSYPISTERPTTLMEAIAMAGGFSEEAAPNATRIVRIDEGNQKTIPVRANDIVKRGDKTQDVVVRPSDIIFVPESFF